mmetsp:Transcript_52513/g.152935  ORF Transcript_52513/g.152935 Transcript_52513/m.152935 type:complete len:338 (+) Transcript_52513:942-1955(+)
MQLQVRDFEVRCNIPCQGGLAGGRRSSNENPHGFELTPATELVRDPADVFEQAFTAIPALWVVDCSKFRIKHVLGGLHDEVQRHRILQVAQLCDVAFVEVLCGLWPFLHMRYLVRVTNFVDDTLYEVGLCRWQGWCTFLGGRRLVHCQKVRRLGGIDVSVVADMPHESRQVTHMDQRNAILAVAQNAMCLHTTPRVLENRREVPPVLSVQHAARNDQAFHRGALAVETAENKLFHFLPLLVLGAPYRGAPRIVTFPEHTVFRIDLCRGPNERGRNEHECHVAIELTGRLRRVRCRVDLQRLDHEAQVLDVAVEEVENDELARLDGLDHFLRLLGIIP